MALTTTANIKARLQITDSAFDMLIGRIIVAVQARIETMCGRIFDEDDYTNELHDGSDLSGSLRTTLIVKNAPIQSITSVEYKTGSNAAPVWVAYTVDDYDLDATAGLLHFPQGLPRGFQNVRITYRGGYASADIPAEIVEVAEELASRIFKRRDNDGRTSETVNESSVTWSDSFMSAEHRAIIKNYRRGYSL